MSEEQYDTLIRKLDRVLENQVINGRHLSRLETKVDEMHSDVRTSISNELLLIRRQDDQTDVIRQIQRVVNN